MDSSSASTSPAHCLLLACSLATDANIEALRSLTSSRRDVFDREIILRILLSYLPESLDPPIYTSYVKEASNQSYGDHQDDAELDLTSLSGLSDEEARATLKKLHLLHLKFPAQPQSVPDDPLTLFLIHRAHRIDVETGTFTLVPELVAPFLGHSDWIKDWYTGAVLPLLRLGYDYYSKTDPGHTLEQFEKLRGPKAISKLLEEVKRDVSVEYVPSSEEIGRNFRGIVAPWVYGTQRWEQTDGTGKRRRLEDARRMSGIPSSAENASSGAKKDGWQDTNQWLVSTATEDLPYVVRAIEGWAGPNDVDFGPQEELYVHYQQAPERAEKLAKDYCQAAFASVYAAETDTEETISGAHSILVRLAQLLDFEPPPDLVTSIRLLPQIVHQTRQLEDTIAASLQPESLLQGDNPLTIPALETFSLLQMLVYSAYLLRGLGHSLSVVKVAKMRFWSDETEQLRMVQRLLHGLVNGARRDEKQWAYLRDTFLWLWDWAIAERPDTPEFGYGIFGKIPHQSLESELLQALCLAGQYSLVTQLYLSPASTPPLPVGEIERVVIALAHQHFDEASNGNKTRGGVKKAADLIAAFKSHFPNSTLFRRCNALIAAAHALSFYSLTLQRGVPFKPVSIRVQEDPVSLISHVLEQNPKSYTQLDNLIEIARNLVRAHITPDDDSHPPTSEQEAADLLTADHRVTSMSIESALSANDFETAYSYVINRLSTTASTQSASTDDISWRAAYLAGRQRSKVPGTSHLNPVLAGAQQTTPQVRRLEQRMDLLSRALLLAPPPSLPEILAAWRRCEEELLTVLAQEHAADAAFDERADGHGRTLPGGFADLEVHSVQPRRKELGRGAAEEAPMGLFEVMRGASAALQRSAAGVQMGRAVRDDGPHDSGAEVGGDGRPQRKRDLVASAVTGGLASGIGWVLGAKPVQEER